MRWFMTVNSSQWLHHLSVHVLHTDVPDLTQVIQQLGVVMLNSVANAILHAWGCDSATPAPNPHGSKLKANPPAEFDGKNCQKLETYITECKIMFATAKEIKIAVAILIYVNK
jgi:hypothetical protein